MTWSSAMVSLSVPKIRRAFETETNNGYESKPEVSGSTLTLLVCVRGVATDALRRWHGLLFL